MEKEKTELIVQTVADSITSEAEDRGMLAVYIDKVKEINVNFKARRAIAKTLDIEEIHALRWKTVGDIFSFLDTSTLAKEHPKEFATTFKSAATTIGNIFPIIKPIMNAIKKVPDEKLARVLEWLGKPTPEHVAHVVANKKSEGKKLFQRKKKVIEIKIDD